MAGYDLLALVAAELLSESAAALGADAPDRRIVASGARFAYDCPMLAVHLESVDPYRGVPVSAAKHQAVNLPSALSATYRVVLVLDCVPVPSESGNPPPAAAVTDQASDLLTLGLTLRQGLSAGANDGTLLGDVDGFEGCDHVSVGPLVPPPGTRQPSGTFAALSVAVSVELNAPGGFS